MLETHGPRIEALDETVMEETKTQREGHSQ